MGADQHTDWTEALASALEWWRDAGVDVAIDEAPRNWLAPAPPRVAATAPEAEAEVAPAVLPTTLEAFATWRTSAAVPETAWGTPILPPEGPAGAELMVVIECPEREDVAAGRLLSGATGRLFDAMLRAIGRDRSDIAITAVAAARPVSGRVPEAAAAQLATIARHHVGLAAPKAVLLIGNATRALIGQECATARGALHAINHDGGKTVAVASFHPKLLLERPERKADAWRDLQLLMKALN